MEWRNAWFYIQAVFSIRHLSPYSEKKSFEYVWNP